MTAPYRPLKVPGDVPGDVPAAVAGNETVVSPVAGFDYRPTLRNLGEDVACVIGWGLVRLGLLVLRLDMPTFVCPCCGPYVAADEDGCCASCGATTFNTETVRWF